MRRLVLLLALAVAACSTEQASSPPAEAQRGAVHYQQVGGTALACTTWGFDTICRNP